MPAKPSEAILLKTSRGKMWCSSHSSACGSSSRVAKSRAVSRMSCCSGEKSRFIYYCRCVLDVCPCPLGFLQQFTRYHQPLYLRSPLTYLGKTHVAVIALDLGLNDVAEAAMYLDSLVAGILADLGSVELGHRGFLGEGAAFVLEPCCLIDQQ